MSKSQPKQKHNDSKQESGSYKSSDTPFGEARSDKTSDGSTLAKDETNTKISIGVNDVGGLTVLQFAVAILSLIVGILTPAVWRLLQLEKSYRPPQSSPLKFPCTNETLSQYLHDIPIPGLHVVCYQDKTLSFYENAVHTASVPTIMEAIDISKWDQLRQLLVEHLKLRPTDEFHQPWATFDPVGHKLFTEIDDGSSSIAEGMFLVFQGGQWIWPGVRKGFQRIIRLDDTSNATLETLSLHPLVLSVEGFLSLEECKEIQTAASPTMHYSKVTLMDKDKGRPASDFRTSQTTFLQSHKHDFLNDINQRTAALVRVPVNHQEQVQVLRYGHTEKYDSHHDYFDPEQYQQDPGTQMLTQKGRRNRMITVLWYLSTVEQGGETVFPLFDKAPKRFSKEKECEMGLRVRPETGKVIVFYSQTPDGALDPYSLHGACPVKEGVKWAANKWVWNTPFGRVTD